MNDLKTASRILYRLYFYLLPRTNEKRHRQPYFPSHRCIALIRTAARNAKSSRRAKKRNAVEREIEQKVQIDRPFQNITLVERNCDSGIVSKPFSGDGAGLGEAEGKKWRTERRGRRRGGLKNGKKERGMAEGAPVPTMDPRQHPDRLEIRRAE